MFDEFLLYNMKYVVDMKLLFSVCLKRVHDSSSWSYYIMNIISKFYCIQYSDLRLTWQQNIIYAHDHVLKRLHIVYRGFSDKEKKVYGYILIDGSDLKKREEIISVRIWFLRKISICNGKSICMLY